MDLTWTQSLNQTSGNLGYVACNKLHPHNRVQKSHLPAAESRLLVASILNFPYSLLSDIKQLGWKWFPFQLNILISLKPGFCIQNGMVWVLSSFTFCLDAKISSSRLVFAPDWAWIDPSLSCLMVSCRVLTVASCCYMSILFLLLHYS